MRIGMTLAALALLLAIGCGDDKDAGKDKTPKVEIPVLTMPPLGVDAVKKMNYVHGDGAKAYGKAVEAYKKKEKDWAAIKTACEEALAKDPGHLEAHRVLGTALAQTGDHAAAAEHLALALAGDFLRWGPRLPEDEELTEFLASPHGRGLLDLHLKMKAEVEKKIGTGVWLIGRRSTFKWPGKSGAASTRGELYAWDEDSKRYLQLSHTSHQLAAWLPSPSGDEIALVGYDKVELPDAKKAKTAPPLIRAWVETRDPKTFELRTKRATFNKVRAVAVYFGPGGQLLVDTLAPAGRWATAPGATWSIDAATGKTSKSSAKQDPESGRAVVNLDETIVSGAARGLKLTPASDAALITEITIASTSRTISLPESGLGDASVPRANPSGTRVAFATWMDPCGDADDAKPSIYVADAKSGQLKHILTAPSRFNLRWLSDDRLIYEDDAGALRIWDATTGREALKLGDKAGFALAGLSPSSKPICRKEPLADVETETEPEEPGTGLDDAPVEDALPTEEPGPATAPQ